MKHAKRIGAFICVIAICFTLMSAPSAHAVGFLSARASGALIATGLMGLSIVGQVVAGNIGAYFGWQEKPSAQSILNYNFPYATSAISNWMNASTIKVNQGVTVIDGVEYDEVFIEPGTFLSGLKTNIFDFKTKWNILSGQSGLTLAKGAGYIDGHPVYNVNGTLRGPTFTGVGNGSSVGPYLFKYTAGNYNPYGFIINNNDYGVSKKPFPWSAYYYVRDGNSAIAYDEGTGTTWKYFYQNGLPYIAQPFEYTYVSGVVPADSSEIPEDYGLSIQFPHDQLQTFYNTYPQYNVDNSTINIQQDEIDIDELVQAIFDQIESMEDIKVEWNEGPVEPEPEPEPPAPVEDVIEGLNVITQQQFDQMQQQTQIQQQQQQMQQQQLQEQQQISQNTSEINDTIKDVTATPDAEQLPDFKFDLRELFPFCIPFDIYRLLSSFDAEPQAPHVQLPIVIESINFRYNLDLDFSAWDPVAQVMRTAELLVYAIALAWATGKVIKW